MRENAIMMIDAIRLSSVKQLLLRIKILSSKVEKLEKTHCNVLIKSSNLKPSVTLTEQISTISQSSLVGPPLDRLDENNLNLVKDAVKRQLDLCS